MQIFKRNTIEFAGIQRTAKTTTLKPSNDLLDLPVIGFEFPHSKQIISGVRGQNINEAQGLGNPEPGIFHISVTIFEKNGAKFIDNVPLYFFGNIFRNDPLIFERKFLDISKSYITVNTTVMPAGTNYSLIMNVLYAEN